MGWQEYSVLLQRRIMVYIQVLFILSTSPVTAIGREVYSDWHIHTCITSAIQQGGSSSQSYARTRPRLPKQYIHCKDEPRVQGAEGENRNSSSLVFNWLASKSGGSATAISWGETSMTDLNLPKQAHWYQINEEADCGADFFFSAITSSVSIPSGVRCPASLTLTPLLRIQSTPTPLEKDNH